MATVLSLPSFRNVEHVPAHKLIPKVAVHLQLRSRPTRSFTFAFTPFHPAAGCVYER